MTTPFGIALPALLGIAAAPGSAQAPTAMVADPCAVIDAEVASVVPDRVAAERQKRDWSNLCRYAAENAALRAPPRVVFIGDSITEGWKKEHAAFFSDAVVDRGISGQTSPQMLARFYADVIALRPKVVHILAGANDIAGNTGPTSHRAFENNIRAMTDLARAHDIRVVIGAIPPTDRFWWRPELRPAAQIRETNTWLRAFAREHGFPPARHSTKQETCCNVFLSTSTGGIRYAPTRHWSRASAASIAATMTWR